MRKRHKKIEKCKCVTRAIDDRQKWMFLCYCIIFIDSIVQQNTVRHSTEQCHTIESDFVEKQFRCLFDTTSKKSNTIYAYCQ